MIARIHLFAAALAGVLICSTAGAQVRSGTASTTATGSPTAQRPARHARLAARPAANPAGHASTTFSSSQQAGVIQIPPSGLVSSEFLSANNSSPADSTLGVPGLGFDFPHLAAISAGLGNNLSLPFHPGGRRGQASSTPILFWGYPYFSEEAGGDQPDEPAAQTAQPQPQPQIIVIQQPVPQRQDTDSASDAGNAAGPAAEAEAAAPDPDAGNFILVRRDGRILFAAVFSVVGTQLQYVTPEGIRRTLEMVDLDADATQQMNEARGTMVQFRN